MGVLLAFVFGILLIGWLIALVFLVPALRQQSFGPLNEYLVVPAAFLLETPSSSGISESAFKPRNASPKFLYDEESKPLERTVLIAAHVKYNAPLC